MAAMIGRMALMSRSFLVPKTFAKTASSMENPLSLFQKKLTNVELAEREGGRRALKERGIVVGIERRGLLGHPGQGLNQAGPGDDLCSGQRQDLLQQLPGAGLLLCPDLGCQAA